MSDYIDFSFDNRKYGNIENSSYTRISDPSLECSYDNKSLSFYSVTTISRSV